MFKDRTNAGQMLSRKLLKFKDDEVVVIAIPRGGLPVALEVARALNATLDVALIKKMGHPFNREYAIGAVSLDNLILNDDTGISPSYIEAETGRNRSLLQDRYTQYYKHRSPSSLTEKTIIIVDDGIATGSTVEATVQLAALQQPAKIIIAVPVGPISTIQKLKLLSQVDEVVCLQTPLNFHAVGQYYQQFGQLRDDEAIAILESMAKS